MTEVDLSIDPDQIAVVNELAEKFYLNSELHGFHDDELNIDQKLMLIVGEVAEAHEELRSGHATDHVYYRIDGKPEGFPTELADIIIRTLDLAGKLNIDIGRVLAEKHQFNITRPHKHGRRF